MALLNIISHLRGPVSYEISKTTPLLSASDFISFDGKNAGERLVLENLKEDSVAGYQAKLSIQGIQSIYIQFLIDCPPKYAGKTLFVDLYNFESNYDSPDQEKEIILKNGINEIKISLQPGEKAPTECMLRIFTTDLAEYEISDLYVYEQNEMPKITFYMIAFLGGWLLIVGMTAIGAWLLVNGKLKYK